MPIHDELELKMRPKLTDYLVGAALGLAAVSATNISLPQISTHPSNASQILDPPARFIFFRIGLFAVVHRQQVESEHSYRGSYAEARGAHRCWPGHKARWYNNVCSSFIFAIL